MGRHLPAIWNGGLDMDSPAKERLSFWDALSAAGLVLILLLFPYPLALLLNLGVPLGWVYLVVYTGWAAFALFLAWLGFRTPSAPPSKWPHKRLAYVSMGALFLWFALTNTVLKVSNAVNWFVFIALGVWMLVEGAFLRQDQQLLRAQQQRAKVR